jgi:hypothetical protein
VPVLRSLPPGGLKAERSENKSEQPEDDPDTTYDQGGPGGAGSRGCLAG